MKELNERKNDLVQEAESILEKAKEETRALEEAETQKIEEILAEVKKISKTLAVKEEMEKLEGGDLKVKEEKLETSTEERAINEEKQFEAFIRNTVLNERANNMTFGDNGAVVPSTIADKIIKKVYDICPILDKSSKYNVKGTLNIPYYDESTTAINVAFASEFNELDSNIGKFLSVTLEEHLAGALALVSKSLINNSQFDIVSHVIDLMATSFARFIEDKLLNGDATEGVDGLTTVSNITTTASATAVIPEELIAVQGSVKDVHQTNACWIMNPKTRTAFRQLKDEVGRYLLQDDITAPFGVTLLGKPVYVSDNMPEIGTGNTIVYYGDMKGLATKFSEELEVQVLREKYATQHAVGVVGYTEFDAKVEDQQKLAALKMA